MTVYRYALSRRWAPVHTAPGGDVCWVMLNPSTADDAKDDQTIAKITEISKRHGYGALHVVNIFAARATDPRELRTMADPFGPYNSNHLKGAFEYSAAIVLAWGANPALALAGNVPERIIHTASCTGVPVLCCGRTKAGHPKHPCRLSNATPLIPFEVES